MTFPKIIIYQKKEICVAFSPAGNEFEMFRQETKPNGKRIYAVHAIGFRPYLLLWESRFTMIWMNRENCEVILTKQKLPRKNISFIFVYKIDGKIDRAWTHTQFDVHALAHVFISLWILCLIFLRFTFFSRCFLFSLLVLSPKSFSIFEKVNSLEKLFSPSFFSLPLFGESLS